jgi:predicted MFS family arabinose efflux permease
MLLVYAITRAAQHGWGAETTVALLGIAALLLALFVAIELRSQAPLLPLRIFRLRTLTAANVVSLAVSTVGFSMFFLLTLYLQQVLHYSPVQTGGAFAAMALTIAGFSNVAQSLVTRLGPRRVLTGGLVFAAGALAYLTQLPVHGRYLTDVFPALVVGGIGMSCSFVAMTIAGLSGISPADAGVASGLLNTTRQIGGAVGLAAVSTIAVAAGKGYAGGTAAALTHGYRVGFTVLFAVALAGAFVAAIFIEPRSRPHQAEAPAPGEVPVLEEAA